MPSEADYNKVANDIRAILHRKGYDDGNIGPLLVRLAWHSSGTFCSKTRTGGSEGGTMRFFQEASDPANAGLDLARYLFQGCRAALKGRAFLEPIKLKHPWISYGDLWTLGGVVAVAAMDGPVVPWKPGRVDKTKESECPVQGRLPDANLGAQHLRDVFYRMGFNDREIVALSGAHGLGRCHKERSGFVGPWTYTPTRFSNQYFVLLKKVKWTPVKKYADGPEQFKNPDDDLMMLPTDVCLLDDAEFKKYVDIYAQDKSVFYADFAKAFGKLLELGVKSPGKATNVCPVKKANI